jgi:pyruvate dehydrogenase E1 component alpha subunit
LEGASHASAERGLAFYGAMARIRAFENAAEDASRGGVSAFGAALGRKSD